MRKKAAAKKQLKCREDILKGARQAFFTAMLAGYASDGKADPEVKVMIRELHWGKIVTAIVGPYKVVDQWWIAPQSDRSSGTTTIFFMEAPVWWMSYSGSYSKLVILFLKEALASAYRARNFIGGRGPDVFGINGGRLRYYNYVNTEARDFSSFSGHEVVNDTYTNKRLGEHRYMGQALI